jgi:F0F1-type ATP synthase membrane subunit b/b'
MEVLQGFIQQFGIDSTVFYLLGLIFIFQLVFQRLYVVPFQNLLHERKKNTAGLKSYSVDVAAEAEKRFTEYKNKLKKANEKALEVLKEAQDHSRSKEGKILQDAAIKAKEKFNLTQKTLEDQKSEVIQSLDKEVIGIADEIVTKVLGRVIKSSEVR